MGIYIYIYIYIYIQRERERERDQHQLIGVRGSLKNIYRTIYRSMYIYIYTERERESIPAPSVPRFEVDLNLFSPY